MKTQILSYIKIIFLALIICNKSTSYAGNKDIVVVESYSKEYKWDVDYDKEIKNRLGNQYQLHFFEMNTKKVPKSEHEKRGQEALKFINKISPILVILGDDAALKFVGPTLEKNKIKTVYLGVNNNPRAYFDTEPKYVTGVLERPLIRRSSIFIKDIIPKAKKVLILFDNDRTSEIVHEDFFSKKPSVDFSGIIYDIFLVSKFANWQKLVLDANKNYDAIILGLYATLTDANNSNVDSEKVLQWTSENSKLPLFAFWDFTVAKQKAMGGLVITGASQGKAAAELAIKLLNNPNTLPSSIFPIYLQEGKFIFSKYELNKRKLALPKEILNETIFVE
ncbi:ABC transporter substrate-binding protein [Spirobacillus cienkowskii]|uniref:ABC transporter substrate-binding protein n=1 Tax=Spirobacillus cienkowskii TaxID=495820 RepID=UPI0030D13D67